MRIPLGIGGQLGSSPCAKLRALLDERDVTVVVGVVSALGARLVERAGFKCCFITGAGLANSQFGLPDIGLVSLGEVANETRNICDAVEIPVIVDADTGYGGPLSVMRTVRLLERAGAAGVQIEDQTMPKRCGHFSGQRIVPTGEMTAKIAAAIRARENPDLVIVARTDANSVLGFEAALQRARAYAEAGADVIFVEAPASMEELRQIPAALETTPVIVNMVEGGKTPLVAHAQLQEMGYGLVLHANLLLRAMLASGQESLAHLREHGSSAGLLERILPWNERQELVNLQQFDELEDSLS